MASAAALISELHGFCLREICAVVKGDFDGLTTAARAARRLGVLSNKIFKRLGQLDTAFAFNRHAHEGKMDAFRAILLGELRLAGGNNVTVKADKLGGLPIADSVAVECEWEPMHHPTAENPMVVLLSDAATTLHFGIAESSDEEISVVSYCEDHCCEVFVERADRGYASIGCWPCTRPVADGEDPRAGRWAGTDKTECGLHDD